MVGEIGIPFLAADLTHVGVFRKLCKAVPTLLTPCQEQASCWPLAVRSLSTAAATVMEKVFFPRPLPCRCRMSRTPFRSLPLSEQQLCLPGFPTSLRRNLHLSPTTAEIIRPLFLIYIEVASPVGRSVVGPLGVLYEQPSPRGLISPRRFFFPAHKSSCARTSA